MSGLACPPSCGACCDPVWLPDTLAGLLRRPVSASNRRWLRNKLRRIGRDGAGFTYRCLNFDSATRLCADYENRPDVCRGYPWYGKAPSAKRAGGLPQRCVFASEVPVSIRSKP